jgi:hypothetical protein
MKKYKVQSIHHNNSLINKIIINIQEFIQGGNYVIIGSHCVRLEANEGKFLLIKLVIVIVIVCQMSLNVR